VRPHVADAARVLLGFDSKVATKQDGIVSRLGTPAQARFFPGAMPIAGPAIIA
jgi:hypothetical protein